MVSSPPPEPLLLALTVIVQVAFLVLSAADLTVIVAVPSALAVTKPVLETVATLVASDSQVTFLLVALDGEIVAVNCCVSPISSVAEVGLTVTPLTAIAVTVIST